MTKTMQVFLTGELLESSASLTLGQLCRISRLSAEEVAELVDFGILEPLEAGASQWQFSAANIHRARCARRLRDDLGINTPGLALALDLLEELESLRERLHRLEG
ncbi:chaperone modulator CbpM [Acidihalobacter ferrooxydans]|uniref:MerR family transcriptional regulator n=1 Tax=Acidihalobacter ferrooxydans TaxID=1765967 RepID=A0A1P8UJ00_9GAMM|nr:chaperone modulator CbpM [Acidihalobacter ferrooxydans]APZ43819.1 MerR family transcriptional regulator [Acidihalobacter ferrooxydans]